MERLVQRLQMLDPPFSGAGAWLKSAPLGLVEAWVQHMDAMAPDQRRRIRNEAAFLRAKVAAGRAPPRARPTGREPCPQCGRAYFSREGVCLVCAGVVVT